MSQLADLDLIIKDNNTNGQVCIAQSSSKKLNVLSYCSNCGPPGHIDENCWKKYLREKKCSFRRKTNYDEDGGRTKRRLELQQKDRGEEGEKVTVI